MESESSSLFDYYGNPSLLKSFPIAMQHLLAMIADNALPSIVLANALKSDEHAITDAQSIYLIQAGIFIAVVATLLQLYPVLKFGAKLPVIMGVSSAYVSILLSIGKQYGIDTVYASQSINGIVATFTEIFIGKIRKFFPPIVSRTVMLTIRLSLYSVAVDYMSGGNGPMQGEIGSWVVTIITLYVVLFCNIFMGGHIKLAAILVGIIVGYIISLFSGMVKFDNVVSASWFALPQIYPFRFQFHLDAILTMSIICIANSVQAAGDLTSATIGGMDRRPTDVELSGGIKANGLVSVIGAFIGALPTAAYSQNVGIVSMTKVIARKVLLITASMVFVCGLIPEFGALVLSVPQAVIGGTTISVFAQIVMSGVKLITSSEMSIRNTTIVGLDVALGMGITQVGPNAVRYFPQWFRIVSAASPVVVTTLIVFFLNITVPERILEQEEKERNEID